MEILKKSMVLITTTGTTTGCTGSCYVIIPDLTVFYNVKIGLTQEFQESGFYDAAEDGYYGTYDTSNPYVGNQAIGLENLL